MAERKSNAGRKSLLETEEKLQGYAKEIDGYNPKRPNKSIEELICENLSIGGHMESAAAYANISRKTLYTWVKQGREDEANAVDSIYVSFLHNIEIAMEMSAVVHIQNIHNHALKDWKASSWLLERRFPERWGKKEVVRLEAEKDGKTAIKDQDITSFLADILDEAEDKDRWEKD